MLPLRVSIVNRYYFRYVVHPPAAAGSCREDGIFGGERPDMSLSNELSELHGIDAVVKEAFNTHEIISLVAALQNHSRQLLYPRVAIGLQNRRMI